MTEKRLSGRNGLTVRHNDIFSLLIRNHTKPEGSNVGHDSSGVQASGDEKDSQSSRSAPYWIVVFCFNWLP
jgi:hypothetical protein